MVTFRFHCTRRVSLRISCDCGNLSAAVSELMGCCTASNIGCPTREVARLPHPRYAEAVNRRSRAEGSLPMKYDVVVETVQVELVAAVRATVPIGDIARAWKPALDQMWAFLNKEWRIGAWTQPVPLSPPGTARRGDEHRLRCPGGAPVRSRG